MYKEYFNYFLELERDFFVTEPYVTIDRDNFKTFSVQYNRIYQSICSEIDCLLKELCKHLEPDKNVKMLGAYCPIIQLHFKYFNDETVCYNKSRIEVQPWKGWKESQAPKWWSSYNAVKHKRMQINTETGWPNYKCANLENVLNALAALYIVEQYYIYSYDFTEEINVTQDMQLNTHILEEKVLERRALALSKNRSKACIMKRWQEAHCYMGFMGQDFFELKNLNKIMEDN